MDRIRQFLSYFSVKLKDLMDFIITAALAAVTNDCPGGVSPLGRSRERFPRIFCFVKG